MPPARRKRVTVIASLEGLKCAEKSLIRWGFGTKESFARSQLISKSTVSKFFNRRPISLDSFEKICEKLEIDDWKTIAELKTAVEKIPEEISLEQIRGRNNIQKSVISVGQITVADRRSGEVLAEVVIESDIIAVSDEVQKTLETLLKHCSGNIVTNTNNQFSSIKITIEVSSKDIIEPNPDQFLFEQLCCATTQVENDQLDTLPDERISPKSKWDLVWEIVNQSTAGRNLFRADLREADLSGANLSSANLNGADLSEADLSSADLSNANLSRADLSGADLSNVNLSSANLGGADLSNTNLSNANLSSANLGGADLSNTNLSNASFRGAGLSDAKLSNANFSSTDFRAARLSFVDLRRANLGGVNLNEAYLVGTNFSNADLSGSFLVRAYLLSANFSHANLNSANLSEADFSNANLSNANFKNANLSNAGYLRESKVGNTLFLAVQGLSDTEKQNLIKRGAIVDDAQDDRSLASTLFPNSHLVQEIIAQGVERRDLNESDLSRADLRGADLSGINLSNASFYRSNLSGANLSNTNLSNANLSNTNLNGADLSSANLSNANLNEANLRRTKINDETRLNFKWRLVYELMNECRTDKNFSNADLSSVNLSNADLSDVNLSNTNLSYANLENANLSNADLSNANVTGVDLKGANLSSADLSGAKCIYSHWCTCANLNEANLSGANLEGSNFLSYAAVQNALLFEVCGLSTEAKLNLAKRGAIIE